MSLLGFFPPYRNFTLFYFFDAFNPQSLCLFLCYYTGLDLFPFKNVKEKAFPLSLEDIFLHGKLDAKKITDPNLSDVLFFPLYLSPLSALL